jgi:uncharacterized protein (DUF433 family)
MDLTDLIECRKDVLGGKPVLKGTRISVQLILEHLAAGSTVDDLLKSYPHLRSEQIRAALLYAAQSIAMEEVVYVGSGR